MINPIEISKTGLVRLLMDTNWNTELLRQHQDCGVCYMTEKQGLQDCPLFYSVCEDGRCYVHQVLENDFKKIMKGEGYATYPKLARKILEVLEKYENSKAETSTMLPSVGMENGYELEAE